MTFMEYYRLRLGRHFIHLGLHVMPNGKIKRELWDLLTAWGNKVVDECEKARKGLHDV